MTLLPGGHLLEKHEDHLGERRRRQQRAVLADDAQQFHHGVRHMVGKIVVSMLSAFAIVWFRFRCVTCSSG